MQYYGVNPNDFFQLQELLERQDRLESDLDSAKDSLKKRIVEVSRRQDENEDRQGKINDRYVRTEDKCRRS